MTSWGRYGATTSSSSYDDDDDNDDGTTMYALSHSGTGPVRLSWLPGWTAWSACASYHRVCVCIPWCMCTLFRPFLLLIPSIRVRGVRRVLVSHGIGISVLHRSV